MLHWYHISISIHALLAESDGRVLGRGRGLPVFLSTLSLRRATALHRRVIGPHRKFLSTLSLRRATIVGPVTVVTDTHFYPRSPCGERRASSARHRAAPQISIHALLAESDRQRDSQCSTSDISIHALLAESDGSYHGGIDTVHISIHALLAESDFMGWIFGMHLCISIHALLAESDFVVDGHTVHITRFLSTLSLRRATPMTGPQKRRMSIFLSTLSLRRATSRADCPRTGRQISIHALLAESDPQGPSASLGRRHISIHALLAESDRSTGCPGRPRQISIHALLAESDPLSFASCFTALLFLSTLSLRRATCLSRLWL